MLLPAVRPVTKPVLDIEATAVFEEVHGLTSAGLAPVNCMVALIQTVIVPVAGEVIAGEGLTVMRAGSAYTVVPPQLLVKTAL
ncbi:MAG: hypothetical protein WCH52_08220 [Bacteroidota bacterium]